MASDLEQRALSGNLEAQRELADCLTKGCSRIAANRAAPSSRRPVSRADCPAPDRPHSSPRSRSSTESRTMASPRSRSSTVQSATSREALACAWRIVIVAGGRPGIAAADVENRRLTCDNLSPDEQQRPPRRRSRS